MLEYWFCVRVWYNCVELEYLTFLTRITVVQGLLWVTCTGHHWLIALRIMIGATY